MNTRRALYWMAFFTGAGIIAVVPEYFFEPSTAPGALGEPAARSRQTQRPVPVLAPPSPGPAAPQPAMAGVPRADLFASHSWHVAPPRPKAAPRPVVPPSPPPPPTAPPLPFRFVGKLDDSERLQVFLQRGEDVYVVGVGDVIDHNYRVERIDATEMTLVYLPLQLSQSLSVGSAL